MSTITIDDMQRDLTGCLSRVESGETVVILKNNRPVAELKPIAPLPHQQRPFGLCAGEFQVPDDFDTPLPEEMLREFEGA